MTHPVLLVAGGGTGGHVFPGLAVAEALKRLAHVDVCFVGTRRGIETRVVEPRFHLEILEVDPIKGKSAWNALRAAFVASSATWSALGLVRRLDARAVLTIGGYAGGPVALAARTLGLPIAVLEPNSTFGFTNKVLTPLASRVYVAWDELAERVGETKARRFGVPLRSDFASVPYVDQGTLRVLVVGGSQGAQFLNESLPDVLGSLRETFPELEVVHQTGASRLDAVRAAYDRARFAGAEVLEFIDDMAGAIRWANLVIARSGAVTLAEIAAVGRASFLVPFPYAADDHQWKNAESLARLGAAVSIRQGELSRDVWIRELSRLFADSELRVRMADAARAHGRLRAADDVASDFLELARIEAPRNGGHVVRSRPPSLIDSIRPVQAG